MTNDAKTEASQTVLLDRGALRNRFLDENKPKTRNITFMGIDVQVRQQDLTQIMEMGLVTDEEAEAYGTNRTALMTAKSIVRSVWLADGSEPVFDENDVGMIVKWPWSSDLDKLQTAIGELSNFEADAIAKTAEDQIAKSPLSEQ